MGKGELAATAAGNAQSVRGKRGKAPVRGLFLRERASPGRNVEIGVDTEIDSDWIWLV